MFSHLHVHTEYSLLNGAIRVKNLVKKTKEMGMKAVAMTDYGALFGAVEFCSECDKAGVKPIVGAELFLPSYDDHKLRQYKRGQDFLWNLVLLVKNETGYKNLCRMLTTAYLDGFYYKPRIDTALLREFNEGLICVSAGFSGEVNHHLMQGDPNAARSAAQKYADIFPNNFYLELQFNELPGQMAHNRELVVIAKELGLPYIATNNVHYLSRSDAEAFEVLRDIQMGRMVASPHEHQKFSTDAYHFKTEDEMCSDFAEFPEALDATQQIVDQCNFNFTYGNYHLPRYEIPEGLSLDEYFLKEANQGLEERWQKLLAMGQVKPDEREFYEDRLKLEIDVINKMGFAGYFLIVSDFIKWAKEHDIPVGPGRGSGAGSLVAYCLKVTDLNPIPYALLFERFLNPERISMPDFDVDFCQDRRGEVIEYVNKKYGNVCQIITFGKMKAKAVIRDVGRVMGLEYEFVDKIAKLIPNEINITLSEALEKEPDFKKLYNDDETVMRLIDTSLKLEGLSRHASVHAAGVIITDKPLWNFAPLYKGSKDDVVVQFEMKSAEKIGLIKFDFLGLKTLTVIQKAVRNAKLSQGVDLQIADLPTDNTDVYNMLSEGDGSGIFQLESSGMRDLMKRLKPSCFEDIIALVALYRPGPMDLIPDFIARKHGEQKVEYLDPRLEPILGPTYGIMVYQEQVMQIAQVIGGYTLGGADLLRRAMGKKIAEEMAKQRDIFVAGAVQNQVSQQAASQMFDMMEKFASYGFNKSHAAAYALISYQTAWLKCHYCTEYMAAIMSTEMHDTDKIQMFILDCRAHDIQLLPPDVNLSGEEFQVEGERQIRYGLAALKGVGAGAIESIVEARREDGDFKSLYDFCLRVDLRRVTKKVLDVLIKSGAFDFFGLSKKSLCASVEAMVDMAVKAQKNRSLGQNDLFSNMDAEETVPVGLEPRHMDDWSKNEILNFEKDVFGFYFSGHPLQAFADNLKKLTTHTISELPQQPKETTVTLGGTVITSRMIMTKKGKKMAFAQFEDLSGNIEIIVFSRAYQEYGHLLAQSEPLILKGNVDHGEEGVKILVESIEVLSEKLKQATRSIHLELSLQDLTKSNVRQLMGIFKEYQGQSLVRIFVRKESNYEAVYELPESCRAMACEPLQHRLNQLFRTNVVRFV